MTKKLILLIIALPLFLMICLFTATNGVSLAIPIGVSGIELLSESTVYMDLDNPKEKHLVEYAVYPTNASNKEVTLSYLPLENEDGTEQTLAKFEYDEETGYLKPLAPGAAEVVLTTVDGGYSVRFTVIVETKELVSISATHPSLEPSFDEELGMEKYNLAPGDTFKIQNVFYPETASSLLVTYTSSNEAVATVNARGVVQARGAGVAVITVTSRANEHISYSFALEIAHPEGQTFVIVDKNVVTANMRGTFDLSVNTEEKYDITCAVVDKEGNEIPNATDYIMVNVQSDMDGDYVNYFIAPEYYGTIYIDVTLTTESGLATTVRCSVSRVAVSDQDKLQVVFDLDNDKDFYDMYLQQNQIFFYVYPTVKAQNLEFVVTCDNGNVIIEGDAENKTQVLDMGDGLHSIVLDPQLVGTSVLTVKVTSKDTNEVVTQSVPLVVKPSNIIAQNTVYGIENSYTIGKYNADGTLFSHVLKYSIGNVEVNNFYENVRWESSSDAVYVNEAGRIVFVEGKEIADFVTFTVKYYCGEGVAMASQSIKIRCVSNGYNVTSYKELLEVTRAGKVVVLQNDIVYDFGVDLEKSKNLESSNRREKTVVLLPNDQIYTTMKSTYDITWYENAGNADKANIKVLISFKEDVYGNGHIINSDNVVAYDQWQSTFPNGQPNLGTNPTAIFQGPLSFVGLSETGEKGGVVSVAGQDNICFAAYEGVTLNNIQLVGRNMDADANGNNNLQNLHYAGTVVEVFGDVNIEYSRVSNGRNVIRAFGDPEDSNRSINLTVSNSVLKNGRDFIMRLGSNKFVEGNMGDTNSLSPYLYDKDTTDNVNYDNRHNYNNFTGDEKSIYDAQFIRTYVTIKNSVLEDPGIFGIGIDTHFAGEALEDGNAFLEEIGGSSNAFAELQSAFTTWKNLAKTSYGVKLTLSGDVRMYCWKVLDEVDSTSLIEATEGFKLGIIDSSTLAFNIPSLVRFAVGSNSNLEKAIYNPVVEAEAKATGNSWKSIWDRTTKDANGIDVKEMQQYDTVHAGIAFFGGGKNYSVLEYDNFDFYQYSKPYRISFNDAGRKYLTLAAGLEDFYFVIYDSTTRNFLYEDQEAMRRDPVNGYSCLNKK